MLLKYCLFELKCSYKYCLRGVYRHHVTKRGINVYSRRLGSCIYLSDRINKKNFHLLESACHLNCLDTGQSSIHTSKNVATGEQTLASEVLDNESNLVIEKAVPHELLLSKLQGCSSVEDQMKALCSTLSLTSEDIQERLKICDLVRNLMLPFFDDSFRIHIFGSSVNGFGFKGCDIDMAMNTCRSYTDMRAPSLDDSEVPSIADVLEGRVSKAYMSTLSPKDQLIFMHTVFLDYYKDSTTTPMFINAYVPIIRFLHDRYLLKCDLSCANWTAFGNSKLLYFYGKYDSRVIPLMMTLRYWAKNAGLIGGGLMFNTYTLSLMVLFFLQTRKPPVLPTAEYVLSLSECFKTDNMSDMSYLDHIQNISPSSNTQSLEELLHEFFMYFLYFDFTRIMSPFLGCSIPRSEFFANEKNKKFRLSTICVQDPTRQSHNVANLVDFKHCRKFGLDMLSACSIFRDKQACQPSSEPWGLMKLLSSNKGHNLPRNYSINVDLAKMESTEQLQLAGSGASKTVLKILQHVLLLECETFQYTHSNNQEVMYDSDMKLILCARCSTNYNTWLGRCDANVEDLNPELLENPMELERAISLKLKSLEEDDRKRSVKFSCKCYLSDKLDGPKLIVEFSSIEKSSLNPILGMFLQDFVPKMFYSAV